MDGRLRRQFATIAGTTGHATGCGWYCPCRLAVDYVFESEVTARESCPPSIVAHGPRLGSRRHTTQLQSDDRRPSPAPTTRTRAPKLSALPIKTLPWPSNRSPAYVLPLDALGSGGHDANDWIPDAPPNGRSRPLRCNGCVNVQDRKRELNGSYEGLSETHALVIELS